MTKKELIALMERFEAGLCTEQERQLVEKWIERRVSSSEWKWENEAQRQHVRDLIHARVTRKLFVGNKRILVIRTLAAALLIAGCTIFAWLYVFKAQPDTTQYYYT